MQTLSIVSLCLISAVSYGIVHDQVTARICIEYFTIGHPPIFETQDPTLLALGWGVIATWWAGLLLGVPAAIAARAGSWPRRSAATLVRPIIVLLAVMAGGALLAGIAAWLLSVQGAVFLVGPMADQVPTDRHTAFLVALWAHSASYLIGFVGGFIVIGHIWSSRIRMAKDDLVE